MHYRPDLVIPGDHGIPEHWIDCGKVAVRKVDRLASKLKTTKIVIVKETAGELAQFRRLIDKKVERSDRIEYLGFDPDFIRSLADTMAKMNDVTLYDVMENVVGVAMNGEVFETTLHR
jgi:dihydrodipicolinate synthase/N-acetylneuraminate lyase